MNEYEGVDWGYYTLDNGDIDWASYESDYSNDMVAKVR